MGTEIDCVIRPSYMKLIVCGIELFFDDNSNRLNGVVYTMIMPVMRRLPVSFKVWQDLTSMKGASQTYDALLSDMIDQVRKDRLEEDLNTWENTPDSQYVQLSDIDR